jgi:hypothetical protein
MSVGRYWNGIWRCACVLLASARARLYRGGWLSNHEE